VSMTRRANLPGPVRGCDAVVSCLGHRLTLKGVFGRPQFLCRDATQLVFAAGARTRPLFSSTSALSGGYVGCLQ